MIFFEPCNNLYIASGWPSLHSWLIKPIRTLQVFGVQHQKSWSLLHENRCWFSQSNPRHVIHNISVLLMFGAFVANNVWESRSESYTAGFYGIYSPMINPVSDFWTLAKCRDNMSSYYMFKFSMFCPKYIKWMHCNYCTSRFHLIYAGNSWLCAKANGCQREGI